tara:strand:- start:480 stop:983 length:504 start_codon:yes stop_codon:yes gene_type:complete
MFIGYETSGGSSNFLLFNPSVIEGVRVDIHRIEEAIGMINDLIYFSSTGKRRILPQTQIQEFGKEVTIKYSNDEDYIPTKEFVEMFNFINEILGNLSQDSVNKFVNSNDYPIFKQIGSAPEKSSRAERNSFFLMINRLIWELKPSERDEFFKSPMFQKFKMMSSTYN